MLRYPYVTAPCCTVVDAAPPSRATASMSESDSPSRASEGPPPAVGASVSADALRLAHPLWARAAGHGGPPMPAKRSRRNGASGTPSESGEKPRFARLSQAALELAAFDADGAESSITASDVRDASGNTGFSKQRNAKKARTAAPASGNDVDDDDDDDDDGYGDRSKQKNAEGLSDDNEDEYEQDRATYSSRRRAKGQHAQASGGGQQDMLAAAAFGGGYEGMSDDDESSAGCSQTSSVRRDAAMRAAFPVKGVSCVGCVLAGKIAPVVRFVNENAARMDETTLWKMAALSYQREVVEPARTEGVEVPKWGWKEVRVHFQMHVVDERLGRLSTLRLLGMMRSQAEQRLLRIEASGERELDKTGAEQVLKIVTMESRERQLLENMAAQTSSARGKAQPKRGGKE